MGRKKIRKMVEIILTINGEIIKFPIIEKPKKAKRNMNDEDSDDNEILIPMNIDETKKDNDNFNDNDEIIATLNNDKIKSKETERANQNIPQTTEKSEKTPDLLNIHDFSCDIFGNATENQYESFLNELDDLYFSMP